MATFIPATYGCYCNPATGYCCQPRYTDLPPYQLHTPSYGFYEAPLPWWVWVVIAFGALVVIAVIIVLFNLLCMCRSRTNRFWCCCLRHDPEWVEHDGVVSKHVTTHVTHNDHGAFTHSQYRCPGEHVPSAGCVSQQALDNNYIPRAHRLTSDRANSVRIVEEVDACRKSAFGTCNNTSHLHKSGARVVTEVIEINDGGLETVKDRHTNVSIGGPLAVLSVGKPNPPPPRPTPITGHHSAAVQITSTNNYDRGSQGLSLQIAPTVPSIYPAL